MRKRFSGLTGGFLRRRFSAHRYYSIIATGKSMTVRLNDGLSKMPIHPFDTDRSAVLATPNVRK
jgi:hypothetical protein